jgi:hypothetical protein
VAYFGDIYSKMRRGIVSHPEHVDASNIDQLRDADFVFVCIDDGPAKAFILEKLEEFGRSFIDVGMGIFLQDEALGGIVHVTTSTPTKRDHVRGKRCIPVSKGQRRTSATSTTATSRRPSSTHSMPPWPSSSGRNCSASILT